MNQRRSGAAVLAIAFSLSIMPSLANATEPLHDTVSMNGLEGVLLPKKCCWVPQPESRRLSELKLKEFERRCSAIGGPVGAYEIRGDRLLLQSLRTCSQTIPLQEVLPELPNPAPATWVSGNFTARLDLLCTSIEGYYIYKTEISLSIVDGVILSRSEKQSDTEKCRK